jgi:hypothetical protein
MRERLFLAAYYISCSKRQKGQLEKQPLANFFSSTLDSAVRRDAENTANVQQRPININSDSFSEDRIPDFENLKMSDVTPGPNGQRRRLLDLVEWCQSISKVLHFWSEEKGLSWWLNGGAMEIRLLGIHKREEDKFDVQQFREQDGIFAPVPSPEPMTAYALRSWLACKDSDVSYYDIERMHLGDQIAARMQYL